MLSPMVHKYTLHNPYLNVSTTTTVDGFDARSVSATSRREPRHTCRACGSTTSRRRRPATLTFTIRSAPGRTSSSRSRRTGLRRTAAVHWCHSLSRLGALRQQDDDERLRYTAPAVRTRSIYHRIHKRGRGGMNTMEKARYKGGTKNQDVVVHSDSRRDNRTGSNI